MEFVLWHLCALLLAVICFLLSYRLLQRNATLTQPPFPRTPDPPKVASNRPGSKLKQPYDAFLLVDFEATCQRGKGFDYPNEIIEFPICLMRWKDRDGGKASQLEVVAEFRSFVKPSWRPNLSDFCTELTGITQDQVNAAPSFPTVLRSVRAFLVEHKLIEKNGKRRLRFCWCSDGPFDIRDFLVKQCFISQMTVLLLISQVPMPEWMTGDVLDVRSVVAAHTSGRQPQRGPWAGIGLNIPAQLSALGLPPFQGREHSGIEDTRNLGRVLTELALHVRLQPNVSINPRRRWAWMGKSGQVLE